MSRSGDASTRSAHAGLQRFLRLLVAPETPLAVIERRATALRLRLTCAGASSCSVRSRPERRPAAEANVEGLGGVLASAVKGDGTLIGLGRFEGRAGAARARARLAGARGPARQDARARLAHRHRGRRRGTVEPAPCRLRGAARRRRRRLVRPLGRVHRFATSRSSTSSTSARRPPRKTPPGTWEHSRAPVRAPRAAGRWTRSYVTACGRSAAAALGIHPHRCPIG